MKRFRPPWRYQRGADGRGRGAVPDRGSGAHRCPTRRRDDAAALAEEKKLVTESLARAPGDFEVLWRAARFYFWMSDDPGTANEQRSKLGKTGWDLAERAIVANPSQAGRLLLGGRDHGQLRAGTGRGQGADHGDGGQVQVPSGPRRAAGPRLSVRRRRCRVGPFLRKAPLAQARSQKGGVPPAPRAHPGQRCQPAGPRLSGRHPGARRARRRGKEAAGRGRGGAAGTLRRPRGATGQGAGRGADARPAQDD